MACSRDPSDRGYAMPAALILSLAIATMAAGLLGRSVATLRAARLDFRRAQAESVLDGAQLTAAAAVVASRRAGPYHWTVTTDIGWVAIVAEREEDKMSTTAAATLSDAQLAALGVRDADALRTRLLSAAERGGTLVAGLDSAALWQVCAPSLISTYGAQSAPVYAPPKEPGPGPDPASWRIGEIWRIEVASADGYRDDRLVRFTGNARHPAATIARRWSRGAGEYGRCGNLLSQIAAG